MKKIHKALKPWYIILLLLILWYLASRMEVWNSYLLPPPWKVAQTFVSMLGKGEIGRAVLISLRRVLIGFLISFSLAFLCAVVAAYAPGFAAYFEILGNFFRNVPPLALISLLILWFGLGELPKIIIIVLASFFPMMMNIASGFKTCDKDLLEVGKVFGLSGRKQFFRIVLPASRISILTGIRIGLGYAWRALIGAEMFAAAAGLGYMIVFAQQMSRSDKVLIGIILIGMIGSVSDVLLQYEIGRLGADNTDKKGSSPQPVEETASALQSEVGAADKIWSETGDAPDFAGDRPESGHERTGMILLEHVDKLFPVGEEKIQVFSDLSLAVPTDTVTVILGKSGCGKTTLLRMIAGLDRDYEGSIRVPENKKTAVVFQESRLMPWLSVRSNITFGLKKEEIRDEKIEALLQLTGLKDFEKAKPSQLSGGMQQRCAIARALATGPDLLLVDEPFASLDYFTRAAMQQSLLEIQRRTGCGILLITHSIDEALIVGDHIVILGNQSVHKRYRLTSKPACADQPGRNMAEMKEDILMQI